MKKQKFYVIETETALLLKYTGDMRSLNFVSTMCRLRGVKIVCFTKSQLHVSLPLKISLLNTNNKNSQI